MRLTLQDLHKEKQQLLNSAANQSAKNAAIKPVALVLDDDDDDDDDGEGSALGAVEVPEIVTPSNIAAAQLADNTGRPPGQKEGSNPWFGL